MRWLLVDTSPIVAAADPKDTNYKACVALFETRPPLVTTELVIAEVGYFFRKKLKLSSANGVGALCSRVAAEELEIHRLTSKSWSRMAEVVDKYECDIADASLVVAAEELNCYVIATLDQGDFRRFKPKGADYFRLILQDPDL